MHPWALPAGYLLKCGVGLIFLQMYLFQDPNAHLNNDAGTFLHEGKILNNVFYESAEDYFRLLTGVGETEEIVQKYMMETDHWSSGDQSIINDNKNVIRLHSMIEFFSFGSPLIHLFVFCLLALMGTTLIYRWAQQFTKLPNHLLFLALLVLPSTLFWSSSVIKEPLLLLGMGLMLNAFFSSLHAFSRIGYALIGSVILLAFKSYLFFSLLPAVVIFAVYSLVPKYKVVVSSLSLILIGVISLFVFRPKIDAGLHQLARKQFDFSNVGRGGMHVYGDTSFYYFTPDQYNLLSVDNDSVELLQPVDAWIVRHGSLEKPTPTHLIPSGKKWRIHFQNAPASSFIEIPQIRTISDLITTAPNALFNALLRPFPTDPGSSMKYMVFVENILIFLFLGIAIVKRRKLNQREKGLILSIVVFIITLSLIIGWITPVIGAIVRYRIPAQLGILLIGIILINFTKTRSHEK